MNRQMNPKYAVSVRILFLVVVVVMAHQGCVGSLPATRPVCGNCEEADRFVRLEKAKSEFFPEMHPPFAHPFKLNPKEWTEILAAIYVQKIKPGFLLGVGKGPEEPAFTTEEMHYLSRTLPKAFEQAQSDEMIVYALSHSAVSNVSEISTGGMFVKNGQLYVILANHRDAVSMPNIQELLWDHPLYSQAAVYNLVQRPNQTIIKPEFEGIKPAPLALTIAYKNLLISPPNSSNGDQGLSSAASSTDRRQYSERSLEDRLEMLKRLRDRDLITEEEFQRKRKELIDRL